MNIKNISAVICLTLLTSCKTSNQITYFQDIDKRSSEQITGKEINYEAKIAVDNQLSILVSSIDPNAVSIFNLPLTSYLAVGQTDVTKTPTIQTYLVDNKGEINFPVLGKIKAA